MTTHDNAAPLPDWTVPLTKHCGEFCVDITCSVCGEYIPQPPPNCELGEN